jgi:hypothetical protein
MPTAPCVTIRGRLQRIEAVLTHGLAQLSITLELPSGGQGVAPTTVECLMATGRGHQAWGAAQRAQMIAEVDMPYEVAGADLRLAGTQLWLLGVERIRRLPADALPPATGLAELLGPRAVMQQPAAQPQRAQVAA